VDACVHAVGVDPNTASEHLLTRVGGIGEALAAAVVAHRTAHGPFRSRAQLLEVPLFTRRTFEQAAGFLHIPDGEHPFDGTAVHPERYEALERLAAELGVEPAELRGDGAARVRASTALREELGEHTFADVVADLERRGRDPRDAFVPFQFRDDVHTLDDLKPGMSCPGIVTNVTNFGAFVDVGVRQDGLVHISRLADRFVADPREVVNPGDRVQVRVVEVNKEKGQIALSMKPARPAPERAAPPRRRERPPERQAQRDHQGGAARPEPRRDRRPRPPREPRDRERPPRPERSAPAPAFNTPFAVLKDRLKPSE
jgi:uncharacterized protein